MRKLPDSDDRRIDRKDLLDFLTFNQMPTFGLDQPIVYPVLLIKQRLRYTQALAAELGQGFEVLHSDNSFTAGELFLEKSPSLVILERAVVGETLVRAIQKCVAKSDAILLFIGRRARKLPRHIKAGDSITVQRRFLPQLIRHLAR